MSGGIVNKNTILVFSTYENMINYVPSGINRIGINNSTGNYYIYNGGKWVLFRETIPYSRADWYPLNRTLPLLSAPPTESIGTSFMQTAWVNTAKYWKLYGMNIVQTAVVATGSYTSSFGGSGAGTNVGWDATGSFLLTVSASIRG